MMLLNAVRVAIPVVLIATTAAIAQIGSPPVPPPSIVPLTSADCRAMEDGNTYQPGNPVACSRLRAIVFHHYGDNGELKGDGRIVVMDVVATQVAAMLHEMGKQRFYIRQARPLEHYLGDDIASMNDNNSSAFNSRPIAGTNRWSLHSYGVAIDINPLQNPVIYPNKAEDADGNIVPATPGTALVRPSAASDPDNNYLNRNVYRARPDSSGFYRDGMAEQMVELFAEYGFLGWGGYWNDPLDYQHFEVGPRAFVERLYQADPANAADPVAGRALFAQYTEAYRECRGSRGQEDAAQRRSYCAREIMNRYGR